VRRGLVKGPRLFFSGRTLSQTGGHGDFTPRSDAAGLCACQIHSNGFSHVADGVPAVRKAAREELRRGATQVKIMASGGVASPSDPIWNLQYSMEELRAIVEEAEGWRTYAMAHAYTPEAITRAVEAGDKVTLKGKGFAPQPPDNNVLFGRARALGARFLPRFAATDLRWDGDRVAGAVARDGRDLFTAEVMVVLISASGKPLRKPSIRDGSHSKNWPGGRRLAVRPPGPIRSA